MRYELKPKHEKVKSYYGKAYVERTDDTEHPWCWTLTLYSYDTKIADAEFFEHEGEEICDGFTFTKDWNFSNTTRRHLREFMRQCGTEPTPKMMRSIWNASKEEANEA